jgi:uncharacterized protein (TIGR02217 family)
MPWTGIVFPTLPLLTFPAKRSLVWSGIKNESLSGKRSRYSLFSYPIWAWDLQITGLRTAAAFAEWQTFVGFMNSLNGTVGLFGYTDFVDNAVTAQSFGSGNGVATGPFQLVRTVGGFTEPVFLLNGAPSIYVAGVLQTLNTNYTIDNYGNVTFTTPPANGAALTWTGSFYWPCRFDDDETAMSLFVSSIYDLKSIKFRSEKLP